MAAPTAPTALAPGRGAGLRYGLLGLPLAFVALPLYVHLPHVYASRYGMSLATLGMVLLMARLLDAITDPWLGYHSDRLFARSLRRVLGMGAAAAGVLLLGMGLLFLPPWPRPDHPAVLLTVLAITYGAFSLLTILHQSWGARLGGTPVQRAQWVAWREGAAVVGVVLASVLPTWLGWTEWVAVFALALALGWLAWSRSPAPAGSPPVSSLTPDWRKDLLHPWQQAGFARLMAAFVLSGMANAVPATLVLFFIQDRLAAPALEPLFLATYFSAAALSLPLWMRGVARWGLRRTWLTGMLLSVLAFAWTATLSTGQVAGFWWVCVFSGLALGTDLALPGALLAGMIAERGDQGGREGAYFGWWNLASKLNLALAAGLALPLLQLLGYQPGSTHEPALQALTQVYALWPCALKLLAAAVLYLGLIRTPQPPSHTPSSLAETP